MEKILAFLEILTTVLPTAVVNRSYSPEPLVTAGGARCVQNNISTQVVSGNLPDGLILTADGHLIGTPTRMGRYRFEVRAANDCESTIHALTLRVEGTPMLVSAPDSLEFHYKPGGPPPEPRTLLISSSWQNMPYALDGDASWITLRPLRGRTPVPDSSLTGDPVTVSVDPDKLAPGIYRAAIKVTAWQTANEPLIRVVLVVDASK